MNIPDKQLLLLFSVTQRGRGKRLMKLLEQYNIRYHLRMLGTGTAPSDVMDLLGIGSSDKDVLLSFAPCADIQNLVARLENSLGGDVGGLLVVLAPAAVSNLFSALLTHHLGQTGVNERSGSMETNDRFSLILAAVRQGHSEQVMQAARRAGAAGGTVIRGRVENSELTQSFPDLELAGDRELVTILASRNIRDRVLEEIDRELGLRREAGGVVIALPVEKAFKL